MSEVQIQGVTVTDPGSVDEIIASLRGFGIEEFEEILTINSGKRTVNLRISNIAPEDEMQALLAAEEYKDFTWMQRVKCEILSRSISYINGINVRNLEGDARLVIDPKTKLRCDIQVVLRNIFLGWGMEVVSILWKVLMVHAQSIEDRLLDQFPDAAVMTEVERRLIALAAKELEEANSSMIKETVDEVTKEEKAE